MATTSRQLEALHLYYVEGWTHRRIGQELGIQHASVQRLIIRGSRWIIDDALSGGVPGSHLVEGLLAANERASVSRHIGRALTRQEELLDALQLRMEQHEAELAMYEQWLSGNSSPPSHCKRNPFDHWELRYLQEHKNGGCLPTSAYNAANAASSCAAQGNGCTLGCYGCKAAP